MGRNINDDVITNVLTHLNDQSDELIQATGSEAAFTLVRDSVADFLRQADPGGAATPLAADEWRALVAAVGVRLGNAVSLPTDVLALACADYWAEEDLASAQAVAEDPDDFDDDASDEADPWAWVNDATERRAVINETFADRVLAWAAADGADPELVERARHEFRHERVGTLPFGTARNARFEIAYLAQDAAGKLMAEAGDEVAA